MHYVSLCIEYTNYVMEVNNLCACLQYSIPRPAFEVAQVLICSSTVQTKL